MNYSATLTRTVFSGVLLLAFSGCDSGPKILPVEGTVQLDGKPLDKILVEFLPTSEGPRSFGETDSQGHFKLTTDDGKRTGASVGTHKVTLKDAAVLGKFMGRKGENMDMSEGRKPRISGKLASPDSSNLSVIVEAGKKNEFTLQALK
jgi:hypothetical protein